jgi:hypothetical protein
LLFFKYLISIFYKNIELAVYSICKLKQTGVIMIDWNKTKAEFGYTKADLPKTSHNKVIVTCDNQFCDAPADVKEREYEYNYARKKEEKAIQNNKQMLCQKCSHFHRKGKVTQKKQDSALPLPPEVDVQKTIESYGYNPHDLSPWSRKVIVLVTEDGQRHEISRAQLNTSKSVKETGHYRPIAWWTQQRRKGVQDSPETKQLKKASQAARRKNEQSEKDKMLEQYIQGKKIA